MKIIDRIKKWYGGWQCRKGRHLWAWDTELQGKAKLGDVYKKCSRPQCGCKAKLTTNFSVVCFNADNQNITDICEVLSELNELIGDLDWIQIKEAG
ncbi:unnamed protein product [marine sediment metagenome]|uniref:Uncharacterized protein n=1 Tax=marine sediment metagenome TaxID=412755 RepID=X0VGU2_9ZZZZ